MIESEFWLKLRLTQGMTFSGLASLYENTTDLKDYSPGEIARLAHLCSDNQTLFMEDYHSTKMLERYHYFKENCLVLTISDELYPNELKEIYQPPIVLFCQGNLELLKTDKLGIVGARTSDHHAQSVVREIMPELVANQLTIVSGLAKGVDALAHESALECQGNTIAVIGTGLLKSYPKENINLQQEIATHHLLLSEFGLDSGPEKFHFPMRNRIIAGLSKGVCVIEAKHHSGSLITANLALQENREVFAVPGDFFNPLAKGCNELILAGAKPVLKAQHIIEEICF